MKSGRWLTGGVLGGLAWAWLDLGLAHAGAVPPTNPATLTLDTSAPVTVSLYQLDSTLPSSVGRQSPSRCTTTGTSYYRDVTDCWLPEWSLASGGTIVYVVVNGSSDTPTLVPPAVGASFPLAPGAANPFVAALTTSAYPGQCANFGSGTDADFTLGPPTTLQTSPLTSVVGYGLTPNDCGGMAVIQVGNLKFVLPKDGSATAPANGIPEIWESLYGGNLDPAADIDTGPLATSPCCDGVSTFDEYRGFIVSGRQVRTDPTQKDLFVHLVNPQCGTASYFGGGTTTYPTPRALNATLTVEAAGTFTASAAVFSSANVGGEILGTAGGLARIVAVTSSTRVIAEVAQPFPATTLAPGSWKLGESLFASVYGMVSSDRVHLLGYTSGAANSVTDEWVDRFVSFTPTVTLNVSDSASDRTINPNRLYGGAQKGLRVIECLDTSSPSVLGYSFGVGSPNTVGNVVLFTQNIVNYLINTLIGTSSTLKYSTASLVNGAWTWSTPAPVPDGDPTTTAGDGVATNPDVRNFILSKALQFYTGMEVGHSLDLTPTVQGTSKTSYGYHYAPGTGDCLDQAITTTSKGGTVTFSIPSLCGNADQGAFDLH